MLAEPGTTFLILELPDDVASELPEGDPRVVGRESGFRDLSAQVASAALDVEHLACDGEVYDFTTDDPADPDDPVDPDDPGAPVVVAIDVLPGSDRNPVNPGRPGVLPVALLGASIEAGHDDDFDVSTIDIASLRLGPGEAAVGHDHHDPADIDGDGVADLVLHFPVADTGIVCGDDTVTLTGSTLGGAPISGTDAISTVPCHGSGSRAPQR